MNGRIFRFFSIAAFSKLGKQCVKFGTPIPLSRLFSNCCRAIALASLIAPISYALESAQTLPKGVRRAVLIGIVSNDVDRRYDGTGLVQSVVTGFNKTLTMTDFQRSEPKLKTLVNQLNDIKTGLGDSLEANSNVFNNYTIQKQILTPSLQMGITDRLTVGVRADIVKRVVTNHFDTTSASNANQVLDQLGNTQSNPPNLIRGLQTLQAQNLTPQFIAYRMYTYKGYQLPNDFNRTDFGDTELAAKYKFFQNDEHTSSFQTRLIVPTGKQRPLDNPYDPGSGNGAWGAGLEFYHEYNPWRLVTFEASAIGRHYFPDTTARAVPIDIQDNLPSLRPEDGQVQQVTRTLGQELHTELATVFNLPGNLWKVWGAYQYWIKQDDKFEGPGNLFYTGMARDTGFTLSMWELGARFSTIQLYRRQQFSAPIEIDAAYNSSFAGRNYREASYGRVDLRFYF